MCLSHLRAAILQLHDNANFRNDELEKMTKNSNLKGKNNVKHRI